MDGSFAFHRPAPLALGRCFETRFPRSSHDLPRFSNRLGLIAEHGYWMKPAAAHRTHSSRDRASTGWDQATDGGASEAYVDPQNQEWGMPEASGPYRQACPGDQRESAASTPVGHHPHASNRRIHGGSRRLSLLGPPSPDGTQPQDGTRNAGGSEWIRRTHNADLSWRSEVLAILKNFTRRTPGSFLELKDR